MQPHPVHVRRLLACGALAFAGAACADEPNPYYIGVNQALTYQNNVFSSTTNGIDSGISTTSLVGGFDQPIGRQRVYLNGNFGYNYYTNDTLRYLNNNSYGVNAGVDWQTIERLSGTVRLVANQSLSSYANAGAPEITEKNIQDVGTAALTANYGITPRVTLDAGYEFRYLNYSASQYAYQEFKQNVYRLGVRYGQSSILTVGLGLRLNKTDYPNYLLNPDPVTAPSEPYIADNSTGKNVDFTVNWVPSGLSTLDARLSFTDIAYTINTASDFRGLTGALGWNYQATGRLSTRLSFLVAPGNGSTYFAFTGTGPTVVENSQISRVLRLSATYVATGKTSLTGNVGLIRNTYAQATSSGTQNSTDLSPSIGLGVSYAPSRNTLLACDLNYITRNASQEAIATGQSYDYNRSSFSCSGQIVLR